MESTCPRCGNTLGENQEATNVVMGMSVKGCGKCGGFLIDYSEAEDVLGKAIAQPEGADMKKEEVGAEAKAPLTGACPFCSGTFEPAPIKFEASKNTSYLDQCDKCQGIWFDKGELSQIFEFAMKEAIAVGGLDENIEETFSTKSTTMNCPRCNAETEFGKGDLLGIEVDKCKKCSGIWFDAGEVEAIVGDVPLEGDKAGEADKGAAAEGECPKCKVSLTRWSNIPEPLKDLYIDFCPKCSGLWFDKGEFKELFRMFAESPFLNA